MPIAHGVIPNAHRVIPSVERNQFKWVRAAVPYKTIRDYSYPFVVLFSIYNLQSIQSSVVKLKK